MENVLRDRGSKGSDRALWSLLLCPGSGKEAARRTVSRCVAAGDDMTVESDGIGKPVEKELVVKYEDIEGLAPRCAGGL